MTAMSFCVLSCHQHLIANPSFGGEPALFWNLVFGVCGWGSTGLAHEDLRAVSALREATVQG